MMPPDSAVKGPNAWVRFPLWVRQHPALSRLAGLSASLVIFLLLLPPYIRTFFWDGLRTHKILAGMLFVFSLLAISLVWTAGQQVDTWVFLFFNVRRAHSIWLDRIMAGITQLGSGMAAVGIALVLFLTSDHLLAYEFMLGTVTLWMVVELVKFLVHRSRPFIRLAQARIVGFRAVGLSFPSGHTSQVFFLATLLAQHFHASGLVVFGFYAIALLVGITRMYVGAHYPRDVLAGAILGSAWGLMVAIVDGYILNGLG
jgi:membrane-associated phospholipid phosphatase